MNKETENTKLPMLAFDLETTGINVTEDRIVTASLVRMPYDQEPTSINWLANPGVDIPAAAQEVHGISTEHAREHGRNPAEVLTEIVAELNFAAENNIPVVGFNIAYDISLLFAELKRHGVEEPKWFPVLDAFVIDKAVDKFRKGSRKLTLVAEHYGVALENAHDANADAIAAALVMREIFKRYPQHTAVQLPELHAKQVTWSREQRVSMENYLRKKKNDDTIVIEKGWPVYEHVA